MNNGRTDASGSKADLLTVLKRRRRTVEQFLSDNAITSMDLLKKYVKDHDDILLSEEFMKQASAILVVVKPVKVQEQMVVESSEVNVQTTQTAGSNRRKKV